ncbi:MAG: hypothetical protein WDN23_12895 [Edaphobacter sp.]
MPSAATIRLQIEAALARKAPSALTPAPRVIRAVSPTGVSEIDALLDGGLPVGSITEMVGPEASGRTAVALSFLRHLTHAGRVCAWVDVSDALSPESAAAAGIDLARLLWVRCGVSKTTPKPPTQYKFSLPEKYLIAASAKKGLHGGGCGGHPRNEVKGLSNAVSGLRHPEAIAPRCAEGCQHFPVGGLVERETCICFVGGLKELVGIFERISDRSPDKSFDGKWRLLADGIDGLEARNQFTVHNSS